MDDQNRKSSNNSFSQEELEDNNNKLDKSVLADNIQHEDINDSALVTVPVVDDEFNVDNVDSQIQQMLINAEDDDLPIFATPAARKIKQNINEKDQKRNSVLAKVEDINERIQVMKEHYKNVEQEIEYTNNRLSVKNAEIHTEKHLQELAKRELSRVKIQKANVKEEVESTQDAISTLQRKIAQAKDKMDEYKIQMNWGQEELQDFMIAEKQKEDDYLALQKYTRADETKVRELTLHIEALTKDVLAIKELFASKNTIYSSKQVEMNRIAEEIARLHKERQYLVEQWEKSIIEMKRRDQEISDLGQKYAAVKAEKVKREAMVIEQRKRYEAQLADNRDVESRTETLSRIVARKREEMLLQQAKLKDLKDELASLKSELVNTSEKIVQKKINNANRAQSNEETKVQLERERTNFQRVKELLEVANNSTLAIEEKAKRYEAELEIREREYELKLVELKRLRNALFKENQGCYELKQEETRIQLELSGNKSISKNYESQLIQLDKEATRQQELLYDAEFQIQQIERKIARGLGERSDEEKRNLNEKMSALESRINEVKDNKKLVQGQLRKLSNDYLAAISQKEILTSDSISLLNKMQDFELENRMIDEETKRDRREKDEMLIQNDLLRLEVRKLRDVLATKRESVYSLENRKQEILLETERKKQEKYTNRDMLKAEIKMLNDEKHKLVMDLKSREAIVNNMRARFEVISKPEDEGITQAQVIIMAAQKREELRRKGDDLDVEIQRGEKEIYALQITLDHLNSRNNNFKTTLLNADIMKSMSSEDGQRLKQVEQMIEMKKEEYSRLKKEHKRIMNDTEEDSAKLEDVQNNLGRLLQQQQSIETDFKSLQDENSRLTNQLNDLKNKISKKIQKHRKITSEKEQVDISSYNSEGTLVERAAKADVTKEVSQVRVKHEFCYKFDLFHDSFSLI